MISLITAKFCCFPVSVKFLKKRCVPEEHLIEATLLKKNSIRIQKGIFN